MLESFLRTKSENATNAGNQTTPRRSDQKENEKDRKQHSDSDDSDGPFDSKVDEKSKLSHEKEGIEFIHQVIAKIKQLGNKSQITDFSQSEDAFNGDKMKPLFDTFVSDIIGAINQVHSTSEEIQKENVGNDGLESWDPLCNDLDRILVKIFNDSKNIIVSILYSKLIESRWTLGAT